MSEKTQLTSTSPQFAHLEYLLQLSLKASTARIVGAYALSNPHLTVQFERNTKDTLTLDSWVEASQLTGANTEEEVIRRGFKFDGPETGLKFTVGSIKCDRKSKDRSATAKIRKVVLCKIGVGRAFATEEQYAEKDSLPEGYDSFYLTDTSASVAAASSNNAPEEDQYHHEYYIKNGARVLPMYIIHYEFDPFKERQSREKPKCDNCESAYASVYCAADNANLCPDCDSAAHSSKLASRHIRTPIGKGLDVFGNCRHHPEKMVEFFCSACHVPVCVFCKMVGNHSSGEHAKHKLVSVSEAYQSVFAESQSNDSILHTRRTAIVNQLSAINNRAKAVEKMASQVEGQIEEMYRRAVSDLRLIVKKKLDVLLGDELELKRQVGEIIRLDDFLKYQQAGDATQFLFSWARHQQYRAELHQFKHFREEIDVGVDIRVVGGINVLVEEDRPLINGSSNSNVGKGMDRSSLSNVMTKKLSGTMGRSGSSMSKGYPRPMSQAGSQPKVQRRTSDFFSETLGALDEIGITQIDGRSDFYDFSDDE